MTIQEKLQMDFSALQENGVRRRTIEKRKCSGLYRVPPPTGRRLQRGFP